MPDISVVGLGKAFGDTTVLDDLSFTVHDKEFLTLLGPSGCGKSTTLMSIAGLQRPDRGRITCGDDTFYDGSTRAHRTPEERNLGVVFQSYAVWPHMTVFENVAFPLRVRKLRKPEMRQRVGEVLELVELSAQTGRYPHELSGGQQQRVALARALVYSPAVLLLDEPFSNLDAKLRERTRTWLRTLQRSLGLTTIFVTHDQHEALGMSDRVLVMDHGVAQQTGTPEDIYRRPSNRFVADFVGHCNFIPATVSATGTDSAVTARADGTTLDLRLHTSHKLTVGEAIMIAVRPEAIELQAAEAATTSEASTRSDGAMMSEANRCDADLRSAAFLGDHYEYQLGIGPLELLAQTTTPVSGGRLVVHIPPSACAVLD
jgi:iron(III) transport system ATP-binding protein